MKLSSVDGAVCLSKDSVTSALVVYKGSAVDLLFAIYENSLHAIAVPDVVVPVALVLGTVCFRIDSCPVELVVLPLTKVCVTAILVDPR